MNDLTIVLIIVVALMSGCVTRKHYKLCQDTVVQCAQVMESQSSIIRTYKEVDDFDQLRYDLLVHENDRLMKIVTECK